MATKHPTSTATTTDGVLKRPQIPDLRFEYSYLRSVQPFIHCRSKTDTSSNDSWTLQRNSRINESPDLFDSEQSYERVHDSGSASLEAKGRCEEIAVQWQNVIWITARDQIMLPLIQGALWGVASYWIPSVVHAGGRVRDILKPHKEGSGVGWLRSWVQNFGRSGHESRNRH